MTLPSAFGSGELWGDGSAAKKLLAASFAAGDGGAVWIGEETSIVGTVVVTDNACDNVELRLDFSFDAGSNYGAIPSKKQIEDTSEQGTFVVSVPGEIGTHPFEIQIPYTGYFRLMARRVGSGAAQAYISGYARPISLGFSALSGSPVGGISRSIGTVNAFHTAGSAKGLTLNYVEGDWIETKQATEVWFGLELSSASATTVEIDVQWREVGGTVVHRFPAENSVAAGKANIRDLYFEHDGTVGDHSLNLQVPPLHEIRIRAKYTGGAAPDLLAVAHLMRP